MIPEKGRNGEFNVAIPGEGLRFGTSYPALADLIDLVDDHHITSVNYHKSPAGKAIIDFLLEIARYILNSDEIYGN